MSLQLRQHAGLAKVLFAGGSAGCCRLRQWLSHLSVAIGNANYARCVGFCCMYFREWSTQIDWNNWKGLK